MVGRGKDHLGAVCVVATHLADRAWAVLSRGMPTSSATPTPPRSPQPRPRPSSPSGTPCRRGPRPPPVTQDDEGGKGPSPSLQWTSARQSRSKRSHEAAFPTTILTTGPRTGQAANHLTRQRPAATVPTPASSTGPTPRAGPNNPAQVCHGPLPAKHPRIKKTCPNTSSTRQHLGKRIPAPSVAAASSLGWVVTTVGDGLRASNGPPAARPAWP